MQSYKLKSNKYYKISNIINYLKLQCTKCYKIVVLKSSKCYNLLNVTKYSKL